MRALPCPDSGVHPSEQMARQRPLTRAPIAEALIDFRAEMPDDQAIERLSEAKALLQSRFPRFEEQRLYRSQFSFGKGKVAETEELGIRGFILRSEDEKSIVQFRRDGFTYNRLAPYEGWRALFDGASSCWRAYQQLSRVQEVTRVAVRYINKLRVADALRRAGEYLTTAPTVPEGAPGSMTGFLVKVHAHDPVSGIRSNVIRTLERTADDEEEELIVDIDIFKVDRFPTEIEGLRPILEQMREVKNRIFFGVITEATASQYE